MPRGTATDSKGRWEAWASEYEEGSTMDAIAARHGVGKSAISYAFGVLGIRARARQRTAQPVTWQALRARAEQAKATSRRLRLALEDVLLFEPPPGAKAAWKRAWTAVRASTSAKDTP